MIGSFSCLLQDQTPLMMLSVGDAMEVDETLYLLLRSIEQQRIAVSQTKRCIAILIRRDS